jgi:hypothetical protein
LANAPYDDQSILQQKRTDRAFTRLTEEQGLFLYLKQPPAEKAKLLKMVLSNCAIDAVSLYPTYRKPFDLIFQSTKTEGWLAQVDDFRTFLGELVSSLPNIESGHAATLLLASA